MENWRLYTGIRERVVHAARHLPLVILFLSCGCLVTGEGGGIPHLEVTSGAFAAGGQIPVAYTCDGENITPALAWGPVPAGTASVAILVTDTDAPGGTFTHWVVYNLPAGLQGIPARGPGRAALPAGAVEGTNDMGRTGYTGPCPPGGKPHHYHFTVSALDTTLNLTGRQDGRMLAGAMAGHVLARGEIVGIYQRA